MKSAKVSSKQFIPKSTKLPKLWLRVFKKIENFTIK